MKPFWHSLAFLILVIDLKASVIITGGTGVLGSSLIKVFQSNIHKVCATYRDKSKIFRLPGLKWLKLDLERDESINKCITNVASSFENKSLILINAAGLYLQGASSDKMTKSINTNCIKPLSIARQLVQNNKFINFSVINISSGDGEICYLHNEIANSLKAIGDIDTLQLFSSNLITEFDPTFEYAFGYAPMYSLSKALLNKGTALLHSEFNQKNNKARILACCPGNFASPMSTTDELESSTSVAVAASHIYHTATDHDRFPGGGFYRYGQLIPW